MYQFLNGMASLVLLFSVAGCSLLSGSGPDAESAPKPQVYTVTDGSTLLFSGFKVTGGQENGRFSTFSGEILYEEGQPDPASLTVVIQIGSIETRVMPLTLHLKSPDFFNANPFKTARFVSTEIKKKHGSVYTVAGTLTLRGITQAIQFEAIIQRSDTDLTFTAKFPLSQALFRFGQKFKGTIKDAVTVRIDATATRSKKPSQE